MTINRDVNNEPPCTTSWAYPWALVKWGGTVEGHAPRTALAWIKGAVMQPDNTLAYRTHVAIGHGHRWTQQAHTYQKSSFIRMWRNAPSDVAIRAEKKKLSKAAKKQQREKA